MFFAFPSLLILAQQAISPDGKNSISADWVLVIVTSIAFSLALLHFNTMKKIFKESMTEIKAVLSKHEERHNGHERAIAAQEKILLENRIRKEYEDKEAKEFETETVDTLKKILGKLEGLKGRE
jgi:hypothetical protein